MNKKIFFLKYYQESINNNIHILLVLFLEMGSHNNIDISYYDNLHSLKILVVLFFINVATQCVTFPISSSRLTIQQPVLCI